VTSGDDQHGREDRRRAERAPVNAEFETLTAATFISDLSELGVFVQTNRRTPIGAIVDLNFTVLLDDPVVLAARGRVVRHQANPPGMGIEFVAPSPELLLRIHDVVSRQRPRDLGVPIGAPDPNDEVTVHRAPAPDASDPSLEMEKTGLYPSIRIQIRQEADEEADGEVAAGDSVGPGGLRLTAGQSQAGLSLAEVSASQGAVELDPADLEEVDDERTTVSGTDGRRTLSLRATDVEIVDDDEDEDEEIR
jgi:hypothetical protein